MYYNVEVCSICQPSGGLLLAGTNSFSAGYGIRPTRCNRPTVVPRASRMVQVTRSMSLKRLAVKILKVTCFLLIVGCMLFKLRGVQTSHLDSEPTVYSPATLRPPETSETQVRRENSGQSWVDFEAPFETSHVQRTRESVVGNTDSGWRYSSLLSSEQSCRERCFGFSSCVRYTFAGGRCGVHVELDARTSYADVAVCFVGEMRTLSAPVQTAHLKQWNRLAQADFFFDVANEFTVLDRTNISESAVNWTVDWNLQKEALLKLAPVEAIVEPDAILIQDPVWKTYGDHKNIFQHKLAFRMLRCMQLLESFEQKRGREYKWVIRSRTDIE